LWYVSCTGLLNKKREGSGKVKPQYQAVSIWEIMDIRILIGGLWVPPPPPPSDGGEEADAIAEDGREEEAEEDEE